MHPKIPTYLLLALTGILLAACSEYGKAKTAHFYLSPEGSDTADGLSVDTPFLSLERAREAAREAKAELSDHATITIELADGIYRRSEPFTLSPKDSGPSGGAIIYQAAKGVRPILDGSVPVTGWRLLKERDAGAERLPEASFGSVWVADFPEGSELFRSLFYKDTMMPRARSKGIPHLLPNEDPSSKTVFPFPKGKLKEWPNVSDVEIRTIGSFQWATNLLPLKSVDESSSTAEVAVKATYPFRQIRWAAKDRLSLWTENNLEALDEPGEWVADSLARKIYFWPNDEAKPEGNVSIPVIKQLVRAEGDAESGAMVSNIHFKGLTFRHVDRTPIQPDERTFQHDWDFYDKPDSVIRFRYAKDCSITDSLITESGAVGIRLDLAAENIRIENSEVSNLGCTGIIIAGYGPGGPDVNGDHQIINNLVSNVGIHRWSSSGILIFQSHDNRIASNLVRFTPYNGITLTGAFPHLISKDYVDHREILTTLNLEAMGMDLTGDQNRYTWEDLRPFLYVRNNVIENNEIYRAKEILGDGNAIYIRGLNSPNYVRQNFIHHCIGGHMRGVIRADDHQWGMVFEDNVIYNCVSTGIGSKGANTLRNNYIINMLDEDDPLNPHAEPLRGYIRLVSGMPSLYHGEPAGLEGSVINQNVMVHSGRKTPDFLLDHPTWPRPSDLRKSENLSNVVWFKDRPQESEKAAQALRESGIDSQAIAHSPNFAELSPTRVAIEQDDALTELDIKLLDTADWGIRTDVYPDWLEARLPGPDGWKENFPQPKTHGGATKGKVSTDFSETTVGELAEQIDWLRTVGSEGSLTIADDDSGKVLVMRDAPGNEHSWMPLIEIERSFDDSNMLKVSFRLKFEQAADFGLFIRENRENVKEPGPTLNFRADGKLGVRGSRDIGRYPVGEWFDLTIETKLGGNGRFSVVLATEGDTQTFDNLPSIQTQLDYVESIGFMGAGKVEATVKVRKILAETYEVN